MKKGYQGGKGGKDADQGRKNPWQKGSGKKGNRGHEKSGKGETCACWTCGEGGITNLYAIDEDDAENIEEAPDTDAYLQPRCLSEECENEQWQEVISKRDKQKVKKAN